MKYPLELKTKVLKDYFDGVDGIRGLERTYGIQHQLILSWIKKCGNPQKSLRQSEETKETCLHLHEPPTFQDPRKELEYLRAENAYLREMLVLSGYHKNGRKKKRFAAIRALATRGYTVKLLCRIAEVSRSGYYRSVEANASPNRDLRLADTIQQIQQDVRYSYGAKRMAGYIAQHEGMPINHKRIARIMHEYLLNARVRTRRHPAYWYRQRHAQRLSDRQCAPNVLDREFTSDLPLKKLVTDVTWVNFAGGTLYLSALMDLFNHEIISYEISTQNTTATALAPILALVRAGNCDGVLLHCDRGPTYRSEAYQRLLTDNKVISSYSRAGNCWDNAPMECFWGHLKCELGYVDRSAKKRSFHSLAQEITDYMSFYNERRIQKHLGWLSPVQYRIQKCGEAGSTLVST